MSHKPTPYAWLAVLSGLCIATLIMSATALRQLSSLPAPCECKPVAPCSCPEVTPCTCDHAALLDLHKECKASIEELRGHGEAIEDRLSKGESRILSEWLKGKDELKAIQRRLDKLEGRKPPVRRQASCGAHHPTYEGIAALGADGEPDSVTGIHLCTAEPWYPGKQLTEWYQAERLASLKRRQERIEKRKLLLQFLFGACA